jgi:hypothetical protein
MYCRNTIGLLVSFGRCTVYSVGKKGHRFFPCPTQLRCSSFKKFRENFVESVTASLISYIFNISLSNPFHLIPSSPIPSSHLLESWSGR